MRHGAGVEKTREKSPQFSGPLKQAFLNGFTLVVGTGGSDAENRAALATARYHAQTWWYRGNGTAPIVTDKSFLVGGGRSGEPGNVVLYGNAQTNRAWGRVLGPDCPVDVTEERVVVGEQVFEGDGLALFAVRPRFDVMEQSCLVGVIAGTDALAMKLASVVPLFVSGVGLPDYVVFDREVLFGGDRGVRDAGWFNHQWSLQREGK